MNDRVKIKPPDAGEFAQLGAGTKMTVNGVTFDAFRATVTFAPDEIVSAEITVPVEIEEVWALPFMSEESFLKAADRYGYRVEKYQQREGE